MFSALHAHNSRAIGGSKSSQKKIVAKECFERGCSSLKRWSRLLDIKDALVYLTIAGSTDGSQHTQRVKNNGEFESDLQSIEFGRHRQLHENHSAKIMNLAHVTMFDQWARLKDPTMAKNCGQYESMNFKYRIWPP